MSFVPPTPPVAELRRCPSCNRWGGWRRVGEDGSTVELHPTEQRGPCREGPWHGSLRGPRNACGQWLRWIEIVPATADQSPSPPEASASPPASAAPAASSPVSPAAAA